MSMLLYLAQHGTAVDKSIDPDRPLSPEGVADVEHVAKLIAAAETAPARVLHSGKTRAMQTAEIFADLLSPGSPPEAVSGISPNDSVEAFAKGSDGWHEGVLVCGHQPFLGRLVSHLLCGNADALTLKYTPGSVAALARDGNGKWSLCWFLRPELAR